jgi:hypothetical protein
VIAMEPARYLVVRSISGHDYEYFLRWDQLTDWERKHVVIELRQGSSSRKTEKETHHGNSR